jgi:tRNA 2-selenouridine synthase
MQKSQLKLKFQINQHTNKLKKSPTFAEMIRNITIENYFSGFSDLQLIDVRSPGEFQHGHIPNTVNIPLFSDNERSHIGTVYKQESREKAIDLGYFYVEPKLDWYISQSFAHAPEGRAAVHCWRGGMRSRAFAEHLERNGFSEIFIIEKGYKSFRNFAIKTFSKPKHLIILGGYTGSGKTEILQKMSKENIQIIDLECLANHKGSAFGALGQNPQPTQEQFENQLFWELKNLDFSKQIWTEDESFKIGSVNIPEAFFENMRSSRLIFIDISKEERAKYLCRYYAKQNQTDLINAVIKIKKRLGDLEARIAIQAIENEDYYQAAILLLHYYDKSYKRVLLERNQDLIKTLVLPTIDIEQNAENILKTALN